VAFTKATTRRKAWVAPTLTVLMAAGAMPLKAQGGYGPKQPPPQTCRPGAFDWHRRLLVKNCGGVRQTPGQ